MLVLTSAVDVLVLTGAVDVLVLTGAYPGKGFTPKYVLHAFQSHLFIERIPVGLLLMAGGVVSHAYTEGYR